MITDTMKHDIRQLIDREARRLGSARRVANACSVSEATISNVRTGKFELITDQMWHTLAGALNYRATGWQIVPTINYRMMWQLCEDAKTESMFLAISAKAGSGKTASLRTYADQHANAAVFYIQCREWNRRDFLLNLCRTLGINTSSKGYLKMDTLGTMIVEYFMSRRLDRPILLIDEADKLRAPALRYLIPLYNACEDVLGCIIAGTDNLEKEIKRGVRYNLKGYDELDSRFGRQFIHLIGASKSDVKNICMANGITEIDAIASIFKEAGPKPIMLDSKNALIVEDLRRLKRIILRERLRSNHHATHQGHTASVGA